MSRIPSGAGLSGDEGGQEERHDAADMLKQFAKRQHPGAAQQADPVGGERGRNDAPVAPLK